MPLRYKDRIMRRLVGAEAASTDVDTLAEELAVPDGDRDAFRQAIDELAESGQIVVGDDDTVSLPPLGEEVVGSFKKNRRGFGFVIPTQTRAHGDLFIPPGATSDALTGDIVRAKVRRRKGKRGETDFTGVIIEVVQRKQSNFTGELRKKGDAWMVFPDGGALTDPIVVADPGAKNAKEGDKVVLEILRYPDDGAPGEGVITRVLGEAGEPDVETQAVIAAYNLPGEFPEACLEQARQASREFEQRVDEAESGPGYTDREDLRDTFILTIDPPDARDFDDALSIERVTTKDGQKRWRLGVHIADVSHFVTPGSPLDEQAKERGNSVYLPRLVIPMLPELLSNGVCSLQEGVPRFCKSAMIDYDDQGEVQGRGFASTVIRSNKRLTYLEAQALIDGDVEEAKRHAKEQPEYPDELIRALRDLDRLSKAIQKRRRRKGMIHLDLPEVELIFDESGRVTDAQPEDDAWTHTLIEMMMVEANESVASLFERLEVPLLRRTHAAPEPESFDDLRKFLRAVGYSLPKEPTLHDLQSLLDATKGTPSAPAVHFAVLRSLTKAEYSPAIVGHYALASDAYAHFTSPIRRFPDLTVHRALAEYLKRTDNGQSPPKSDAALKRLGKDMKNSPLCPPEQTLVQIGGRCNRTEQNAEQAENDLRDFLVLQLFEDKVGEVFPAVVTGVTPAGVFLQIQKYLIEGMVKADDLPIPGGKGKSGRWKIDPKTGALVEQNTGRSYRLGDRVEAAVSRVNLPARQLELLIPDEEAKKREGVGKALNIGGAGGGLGKTEGAFKQMTGAERRSRKSKRRDKSKPDHRKQKKQKGKGQ